MKHQSLLLTVTKAELSKGLSRILLVDEVIARRGLEYSGRSVSDLRVISESATPGPLFGSPMGGC